MLQIENKTGHSRGTGFGTLRGCSVVWCVAVVMSPCHLAGGTHSSGGSAVGGGASHAWRHRTPGAVPLRPFHMQPSQPHALWRRAVTLLSAAECFKEN